MAAVVVVIMGTASAFPTVREFVPLVSQLPPMVFVDDPLPQDRVSRTVDGVHFSLNVPPAGQWENGPTVKAAGKFRFGSLLISRSTVGGQRAEAVVFWTGFPKGGQAALCESLLSSRVGPSAADLAAAVAAAPGTELVTGPSDVTVGGRPAKHVVPIVREDVGCEPGFFFTWKAEMWGAFWLMTSVGDKINVWIVDIDGKRLVIEAVTRQPESQGVPLGFQATPETVLEVEAEVAQIVSSIRFD